MVWTAERSPNFPDVPTLKELGYPMVYDSPFGIAGPKGMDPKIVAKLHDAFKKAIEDPAVIATLAKYDMVPNYKNTEDYKKFVAELTESERKVIDTLGLAKRRTRTIPDAVQRLALPERSGHEQTMTTTELRLNNFRTVGRADRACARRLRDLVRPQAQARHHQRSRLRLCAVLYRHPDVRCSRCDHRRRGHRGRPDLWLRAGKARAGPSRCS